MNIKLILDTRQIINENIFFGYYNKHQFKNNKLLFCSVIDNNIDFNKRNKCQIGYIDFENEKYTIHYLKSVNNFNYQAGCNLSWFFYNNEHHIIYNNVVDGKVRCEIINLAAKIVKTFDFGYHSFSNDFKYLVLSDFIGLAQYRNSYSYTGIEYTFNDEFKDCFYIYNLTNQSMKFVHENFINAKSYFYDNFNISNTGLITFNLRQIKSDVLYTHFASYDINLNLIIFHNKLKNSSHYNFINNDEILIWTTIENDYNLFKRFTQNFKNYLFKFKIIRKILLFHFHKLNLKKIQNIISTNSFYIYNLLTKTYIKFKYFSQDGHPTILINKCLFFCDTYADNNGVLSLNVYNSKSEKFENLLNFKTDKKYINSEFRCDLHPRITDSFIIVDCLENDKRFIQVFKFVT